jgi:ATP-binding cassette subfamily F protein 3
VSFVLHKGDRIGLVGPNGSGKSSLFKAIMGQVELENGTIKVESEQIGYLPQEIEFKDEKLSGGQKTRLALEKILLKKPSVLLLDEPTNHLDLEATIQLEKFIRDFKGVVFIISHDRQLLDNTVNKILEIDPVNSSFNEYTGNYSQYLIEREKRISLQESAYKSQQQEKKRLENWLTLKRQEASIYSSSQKGKMIRSKEKYLEREIYNKEILRPDGLKKIKKVEIQGDVANAKLALRCSDIHKSFGDKLILRNISFEIRGKERILLTGSNGSGKTTLLKIIIGEIKPDSGEVRIGANISLGYFAQEHELLDHNKTVLEEFMSTGNLISGKDPRQILGSFLFLGQSIFKKVSSLSLGERVRLIFAKLTNQYNDLLILDEPTNHLDIQSKEVIEKALVEYQGAILVVSHDRYFIDKIRLNRFLDIKK